MFCKNCGTQMADDAVFCANCGAPAAQEQQAQPQYQQPQYQPQPQYAPQPQYQPQYGQPQYGQPQYAQAPAEEPGKGMATASMILGIASFFCFAYVTGILAIIFGCVAKNKGYTGNKAKTGIICGAIGLGLTIILQIVGVSLLSTLGYY